MTHRERMLAILNYENYDKMPVIHFGYWRETLEKWASEGHISNDLLERHTGDGCDADKELDKIIGWDFGYSSILSINTNINPPIEIKVLEEYPDGTRKILDPVGVIVIDKPGTVSIPMEVDHLLKTRKDWEEEFLPRLQYSIDRISFPEEKLNYVNNPNRENWCGLYCGSLFGMIRNWIGVEGSAYIYADDPDLFVEMIDTVGNLTYECVKTAMEVTSNFDFAHFWEDICFKSGPLISPRVFDKYVGPHYKKITDLLKENGIKIVSLDCDGLIDALIPTWLPNGVNTMFPMEVGTWDANIKPWREQFGKDLRGIGGMNKTVFAYDYAAIDAEIERLKPLVELGGYIPCPDHRIAPDAKFENVKYYVEKMHEIF